MKLAMNQGTTLENSTLEQDLQLLEKYGYDYIEIRSIDKLKEYLETHSIEELVEFFQTHHLKPLSLNALVYFNNRTDEDYKALLEEYKEMLEYAKILNVDRMVVVPLVSEKKILRPVIKQSCVEVLTELSDLAKPYGVKLALEFIGHPHATVNTLSFANEIVAAVDRENVGIVFDTYQYYAMNSTLEDLRNTDFSKVFLFHINDVEDYIPGIMLDEDRVFPGDGVIDLKSILKIIKEKGFSDHASIEVFRPEYYQLEAEEVVKTAKEKTLKVLAPYFLTEEVK
ncbi:sugar phosphate isomerase/epimerase [Niallia circulans]|jgi:2-keto-myo-inositol isomerase|uniref:Isomerase n=1 Tax=Niallia circulans TaxID=1397 RepID=A0A0J1ILW2_NIACI|nr:sugar phosphate isomerase/epimerase [Niallia circulans]KLV26946.1 isomerase [Niallia circulans]MCM2979402.1 sugar phosphate isomerase/epimerase [Niallia circulans]MDR4318028.1 sugar phosphate isomerase/epimerase [Niallia circulans]MED3839099.1 sugar phosphate isomerase/epimerase [Niallia circulans]MED4242214.1 sugar phosphate isomerase/epimerase [Niallia circulans]